MKRELGRATGLLIAVGVVALTIGCDRVTKEVAARHLAGRPRASYLAGLVRLEYTRNPGGFLSLGAGLPDALRAGIFTIGAGLVLGLVGIVLGRQLHAGRSGVALALVWAGGIANLFDRVTHGSVIDFLNVGLGPLRTGIFNVADVAITLGLLLLAAEAARSRSGVGYGIPRGSR